MSKVLYIKANSKPEELSRTFKISNAFVEAYKQFHPEDEIVTLDLYRENIGFLTEKDVLVHSEATDDSRQSIAVKYARQFRDFDKYIFAEPLWNLGIPAILKAYFDYISQVGITFKYSPTGPIGLCRGKKAINITTQGGAHSEDASTAQEHGNSYIKTMLNFFGIEDYKCVSASKLDIIGMDVEAIVNKAIEEAKELAKSF